MKNKSTHGGAGRGQGRHSLPEECTEKRVKIYNRLLEALKEKGLHKRLSAYLNDLIERDLANKPPKC